MRGIIDKQSSDNKEHYKNEQNYKKKKQIKKNDGTENIGHTDPIIKRVQ